MKKTGYQDIELLLKNEAVVAIFFHDKKKGTLCRVYGGYDSKKGLVVDVHDHYSSSKVRKRIKQIKQERAKEEFNL